MGQVLIELDEAADEPVARVGAKARSLARLARAGFAVPPGVVVPSDVRDGDLDVVAAALHERFGGVALAVRSSADVEDGATRSFAGAFHTELRVAVPDVVAAIRRVRASRELAAGAPPGRMGVLVMAMIDADAAGVAFSVDPVTGDDVVVVEAVAGTAEALVDGTGDPGRWRVVDDGQPTADGTASTVGVATVGRVAELTRAVARHEGHPVDVEWASDHRGVHLLQARPVTGPPTTFEIPDDLPPGTWMREEVHFPEPLTRLTASVVLPVIDRANTRIFRTVGAGLDAFESRLVAGHVYHRLVPAGVPGRALARGAAPPPALLLGLLWRLHPRLRAHARAAAEYLAADRDAAVLDARRHGPPAELFHGLEALRSTDVTALDGPGLAGFVRAAMAVFERGWEGHADYAAANAVATGRFVHGAVSALGCTPDQAAALLVGHGEGTTQVSADLAAVRAAVDGDAEARRAVEAGDVEALLAGDGPGGRAVRAHLDGHGDLLLAMELAVPSRREAPEVLLQDLRTSGPGGAPPPRTADLEARLRAHPQADRLLAALERARLGYAARDRDSLPMLHAMAQLRRAALEAGRRLVELGSAADPGDVFGLDVHELTAWLEGAPPPSASTIAARRTAWGRGTRTRPPAVIGPPPVPPPSPRFLPAPARTVARWVGAVMPMALGTVTPGAPVPDAGRLVGAPASPGRATATARVVRDPRDLARLAAGEVLVCQVTTVAWAPAFARAGAVVTQAGGVLSHPAIQAREHGVPAVVGVPDATRRIGDGARVTVDGDAGTVVLEAQARG